MKVASNLPVRWPWTATTVTLYFADGKFFVPVSRRMPTNDDLPRAVLKALLVGPSAGSGLKNPIPPGVAIRSFKLGGGVAQVDLSAAMLIDHGETHAETAIIETMTALPGVTSVSLSVEGKSVLESAKRVPLLYYASANGLVAVPVSVTDPHAALNEYLSGPPDPELTGLPPDVRLLTYQHDPVNGLLSLNFTYTPSLHALAMERSERMRTALLGLIAGLTEFPQVRAVQLDFEGHTRLGLGQCSDLLRTPQPRPLRHLESLGVELTVIGCAPDGAIALDSVLEALRPDTRLLVTTHASNVSGTLLPIGVLASIARERRTFYLVDASQTAGTIPIDLQETGIDILAFSGHKGLLGPTGTGGLYIRDGVALTPLMRGGTGSDSAHESQPEFLGMPTKAER
ncbi:MAG: aminotransferase class V-fold PLP-dependent enzyme [Acidobacteria bacterium]|nr:aminotransferase class V-fold PLP-dependent enzyme [Acidobacteriota bacterium]